MVRSELRALITAILLSHDSARSDKAIERALDTADAIIDKSGSRIYAQEEVGSAKTV